MYECNTNDTKTFEDTKQLEYFDQVVIANMATAAVETCQPLSFGVVGIHHDPSILDFKSSLDT